MIDTRFVPNKKRHADHSVVSDRNGWVCERYDRRKISKAEDVLEKKALSWFEHETVKSIDGLEWMLKEELEKFHSKRKGGKSTTKTFRRRIIGRGLGGEKYYAISIGGGKGRWKQILTISEPI